MVGAASESESTKMMKARVIEADQLKSKTSSSLIQRKMTTTPLSVDARKTIADDLEVRFKELATYKKETMDWKNMSQLKEGLEEETAKLLKEEKTLLPEEDDEDEEDE